MNREQEKTLFYGILMDYISKEQIKLSLPKCMRLWGYFCMVYEDMDKKTQRKVLKKAKKVLKEKNK